MKKSIAYIKEMVLAGLLILCYLPMALANNQFETVALVNQCQTSLVPVNEQDARACPSLEQFRSVTAGDHIKDDGSSDGDNSSHTWYTSFPQSIDGTEWMYAIGYSTSNTKRDAVLDFDTYFGLTNLIIKPRISRDTDGYLTCCYFLNDNGKQGDSSLYIMARPIQ